MSVSFVWILLSKTALTQWRMILQKCARPETFTPADSLTSSDFSTNLKSLFAWPLLFFALVANVPAFMFPVNEELSWIKQFMQVPKTFFSENAVVCVLLLVSLVFLFRDLRFFIFSVSVLSCLLRCVSVSLCFGVSAVTRVFFRPPSFSLHSKPDPSNSAAAPPGQVFSLYVKSLLWYFLRFQLFNKYSS